MKKTSTVVVAFLVFILTVGSLAGAQELSSIKAIPGIQPGSILVLQLTGNAGGGSVWGSGIYTTDSSLAAAAVHAGVLPDKAKGMVIVEILPGESSYKGTSSYGVTSAAWGAYGLSFRFLQKAPSSTNTADFFGEGQSQVKPPVQVIQKIFGFDDPTVLGRIRTSPGNTVYVRLTGSTEGRVWGSGVYTLDSGLAAAAVHSGALAPGQNGVIKLTILPGRSAYEGTSRNGVSTSGYGAYGGSFSVEKVSGPYDFSLVLTDPGIPGNFKGVAPGQVYTVWVVGSAVSGGIWGTDVYTSDSPLAKAAVHAGLLADGVGGPLIVRILPGQASYVGSSRYGVTTSGYGAYGLSYSLEAAR
jgi:hypothetical protein